MKNKKSLLLLIFAAFFALQINAQGMRCIKLNEVLITNQNSIQDEYGTRSGWLEIYNSSFAPINLRGCYITNDKSNIRKFRFSMTDEKTIINKRQHLLVWLDNNANKGILHTNFKLDPTKENWIGLYEANGLTLIDEITIPAQVLQADQSFARITDGASKWIVKSKSTQNHVTPSSNNNTTTEKTKVQQFAEEDPTGVGMAISAMTIVFLTLLVLAVSFKLFSILSISISRRTAMESRGITDMKEAKEKSLGARPGEVFAAISMAMHEYQEGTHDIEDMVLTINKVKRNYSPWSSKIYSMNKPPKKH